MSAERFWVYIDNKVSGPVEIPALRKLTGFNLLTQVCPEGEQSWRVADEVIEIKAYFLAPPHVSLLRSEKISQTEGSTDVLIETLPETAPADPLLGNAEPIALSGEPAATEEEPVEAPAPAAAKMAEGIVSSAGPAPLRIQCSACGYKNPRDVEVCMKCGARLSPLPSPSSAPAASVPAAAVPTPLMAPRPDPVPAPISEPEMPQVNPTIEIPVTKVLIVLLGVSFAVSLIFVLVHLWQAHARRPRPPVAASIIPSASRPMPGEAGRRHEAHRNAAPHHPRTRKVSSRSALPGMTPPPRGGRVTDSENSVFPAAESSGQGVSVLGPVVPQHIRESAPLHSPYTEKRRSDAALWVNRQDDAIRLAQESRLYGGERTAQRNTEILMQILRDREYLTAFKTGKRLHLYNDVDWAATQQDGPLYEVHVTFSGGRHEDGSPWKPLLFAFDVDLERRTVRPGGEGEIRGDTLHGFFDESQIPPEARQDAAKDTEELVLASQPDASPLALDTVARHFVAAYSLAAAKRVAEAYNLESLKRMTTHWEPGPSEAASSSSHSTAALPAVSVNPAPDQASATSLETPPAAAAPTAKHEVSLKLEPGAGREREIQVRMASTAPASKIWEALTGYDAMAQFIPDLLESQVEGQDGPAQVVHVVFLTRVFFFIFKTSVHLRITQDPTRQTIQFERIAGDFDQLQGTVSLVQDPGQTRPSIVVQFSVTPEGHTPSWAIRTMARRFLIPALDALCSRAEAF